MNVSISGSTVKSVAVLLVVLAMAVFVWPTQWTYPLGGVVIGDQLVHVATRVHRFTGRVEALGAGGWVPLVMTEPAPPAAPATPDTEDTE